MYITSKLSDAMNRLRLPSYIFEFSFFTDTGRRKCLCNKELHPHYYINLSHVFHLIQNSENAKNYILENLVHSAFVSMFTLTFDV